MSKDTPILFHVGLHKTATTALQSEFFTNQNGFKQILDRNSSLSYFVDKSSTEHLAKTEQEKIISYVRKSDDDNLFPVISNERLFGHPISGGYDRLNILHRINDVGCNVKILLIIREQDEWLYSAWKQIIKSGGSISLADFLTPPKRSSVRVPPPRLDYLDYAREIRVLNSMFGASNVCVLPYELLKNDFQGFAQEVFYFLGLNTDAKNFPPLPRMNESLRMNQLNLSRLLNRIPFFKTGLYEGKPISTSFSKRAFQAAKHKLVNNIPEFSSKKAHDGHRELIRLKVSDFFVGSNREASDLLKIDLGKYGYRL